ncbi:MAG: glycerate kinase [Spirochaetaceae bacterium]
MNRISHSEIDENIASVLEAALQRVDPARMLPKLLSADDDGIAVASGEEPLRFPFSHYSRIMVLGIGKAAAQMAAVVEKILGERIDGGAVLTKYGHGETLSRLKLFEAGHPIPDEEGVKAAREIERMAEEADEHTLCITLISGGGSALLVNPFHDERTEVSLQDIQQTTKDLLACGALIQEINCIRKHISHLKGGRLAKLLAPATSVNLILSDVVGDDLGSIASGLTVPDTTSFTDAQRILERYGIDEKVPRTVREVLRRGVEGSVPETPKPGDPLFERVHNILAGSNIQALDAARTAAEALGYNTVVLSSQITGEAREVAKVHAAIARDIAGRDFPVTPPACVIAGGETTVAIRGGGRGGRNQEQALSFLREMGRNPGAYAGVTFVALATDGDDGETGAAGGVATVGLLERAMERGLHPEEYLSRNDSFTFFSALGSELRTGKTGTNVGDIQLTFVK